MDRDIMTPEANGISRREMLIGAGILAAGYGVGQLATAEETFGQPVNLSPTETQAACEWPTAWSDPVVFDAARREAALRAFERYRAGAG